MRNVKDGLDESELGILFNVMARFMFFPYFFNMVEGILSLVNHVVTKKISLKQSPAGHLCCWAAGWSN